MNVILQQWTLNPQEIPTFHFQPEWSGRQYYHQASAETYKWFQQIFVSVERAAFSKPDLKAFNLLPNRSENRNVTDYQSQI
jgi:hypothetical protein